MQMTIGKLLDGLAAVPLHVSAQPVTGLTADSRTVKPGYLFAALPGTKADGSKFLSDAAKAGAVAAISETASGEAGIPVLVVANARRALALMAARFHGAQPETIVAVTGTNGKTSVAAFVRQIWDAMGFRAASLGTIGVVGPSGVQELRHTTPDPVELHAILAALREDHVKHLAIEASSHGLVQHRLDGLILTAGAFTNLTHDHLDYHPTLEDYFNAKMRLFNELLPSGAAAVVNMDGPFGDRVMEIARRRNLVTVGVGRNGEHVRLLEARTEGLEQHLRIQTGSAAYALTLPLVGEFQVSNALVAAALVTAAGGEEHMAFHALQSIKGAPGRLELVGRTDNGASVFVDDAHTPDALENAIRSLRPFASGKITTVFGCGGDRDKAKRPIMGGIATRLSDRVIVTDDNPRSEDPARIRQEILATAKGATEIGNRADAIRTAVEKLKAGDIALIAGKGHEAGQTIGTKTVPFSDHDAVRAALKGEEYRV